MSVQTTSLLCSKPFNGFSLSFFQSGVSIPVATVDTGDWKALCCENCLAHGKMLRNHPWPHPAPASACLHPYLSRDNQKCHRTLLMSPRGKTTPCWEQLPWHKLLIPYDNLQDYSWVTCSSWEPGRGWCHMDREDRMTEWWVSPQSRLEYCYQKGGGGWMQGWPNSKPAGTDIPGSVLNTLWFCISLCFPGPSTGTGQGQCLFSGGLASPSLP